MESYNNLEKYIQLKNILLQSYSNTYNLVGGIRKDLIDGINEKLDSFTGLTVTEKAQKLSTNLDEYKRILELLIQKTNEKIVEGDRIKTVFDRNGNTIESINKLLDTTKPESLGSFIEKYKNFLKQYKFQKEFLVNESNEEIIDKENPDKDLIFIDDNPADENEFIEFNKNFLKIFMPYIKSIDNLFKAKTIDEQKQFILENLDEQILIITELTELSKQYEKMLLQKKKSFDNIIDVTYNKDDLKFISKDIPEDEFKEDLKEKQILPENTLDIDSFNLISQMIKNSADILELDDIPQLNTLQNDLKDLHDDLDFVTLLPKKDWTYLPQAGGAIEFTEKFAVDINTNAKLVKFIHYLEKLFETIYTTINLSQELKELQLRYNYYCAYIFGIIKAESTQYDRIVYRYRYRYINKEVIQNYLNIILKIEDNFKTNLNNPVIKYFNQYHYYTLNKLHDFLTFIMSNYDSDKIIDIETCTNSVRNSFIIFNHFKDILDKQEVN